MKLNFSITIIVCIFVSIITRSTSIYKGVSWDEKRKLWKAEFYFNNKISKSYFENEVDAATKINQLCKKMQIPQKNPELPQQQKREKTSRYKGVYWHRRSGRWYARIPSNGGKKKFGGSFNHEIDAAKRVNQLCVEMDMSLQNPGISAMPAQKYEKREKKSRYKGVYWHRRSGQWYARLPSNGGKQIFGGTFNNEIDAAKRVNQLCEGCGIPLPNPGISSVPNLKNKKTQTSQYKGVYWNKNTKKWCAKLFIAKGNEVYGGGFINELDAAKKN